MKAAQNRKIRNLFTTYSQKWEKCTSIQVHRNKTDYSVVPM